MRNKVIIAITSMLVFGLGAWAQTTSFTVTETENGTKEKPFLIKSVDDLNALASDVNSGNSYEGKYFKLTAEDGLDYSGKTFTPIGIGEYGATEDYPFKGKFDGNNKTIKNITYTNDTGVGVGLFGNIQTGIKDHAEIKNVSLESCSFTGNIYVGAIVGYSSGTTGKGFGIYNCTVASNVSVTATTDNAENAPAFYAGGIIGYCGNLTVSNCTSAANVSGCSYVGGIAGILDQGTIENCFYTGCSDFSDETKGIIAGDRGYPENPDSEGTIKLTLYNDDSYAIKNATRLSCYNGVEDVDVTLGDRILYKDGNWNTLCLPFDVTVGSGQMEGATAMTLNTSEFTASNGELTLNFTEVTQNSTINAGTPFIVNWTGTDVSNPVFCGVTIDNTLRPAEKGVVDFVGSFSPVSLTANDKTLYLGAENTLYYPSSAMYVNACRAVFQLKGSAAGGNAKTRSFVLNFGESSEETGISPAEIAEIAEKAGAWFTLDGRRLGGKPTRKGVYVNNGRKVVVK